MYKINGCNKLTCYWGQPWHKHIKKNANQGLPQKTRSFLCQLMLKLASLVKTITTLNMLMHARVTHCCINYHKYHKFFLHFSFLNASKTLNKLVLSILWNICQSSLLSRGCVWFIVYCCLLKRGCIWFEILYHLLCFPWFMLTEFFLWKLTVMCMHVRSLQAHTNMGRVDETKKKENHYIY